MRQPPEWFRGVSVALACVARALLPAWLLTPDRKKGKQRIPRTGVSAPHRSIRAKEPPHYLGSGSFMLASAYPITAMAAAFSRSSLGTILSSVSAAL